MHLDGTLCRRCPLSRKALAIAAAAAAARPCSAPHPLPLQLSQSEHFFIRRLGRVFAFSYLFAQFNSSFPSPLSLICRIRHPHDPTPLPCHGSTALPALQSSSPTCPQVLPSMPRLSCLSAPYFSLLVLSQPLSFILSTADFL